MAKKNMSMSKKSARLPNTHNSRLTTFEWFAGMAMQGLLANGAESHNVTEIAKAACDAAEAIINNLKIKK
jgi:uncharacterized membrane protein YjjP (DUF1212 family)